jgi:CheY-like chemotaxis protein
MDGHRPLVVEDDPAAAEIVCRILRARGDAPIVASNVESALAILETERPCYFVLDQGLPQNADDDKPDVLGGHAVTTAARASDTRHTGRGFVTPILVLTAQPRKLEFVTGLFKDGIAAYVEKDVVDRVPAFNREITEMLARAGRQDHAQCAALAVGAALAHPPPNGGAGRATGEGGTDSKGECAGAEAARGPIVVELDGGPGGGLRRTGFLVNGARTDLQDAMFARLVRLVAAHEDAPEAYSPRHAIGILESRDATTAIRKAFKGLVPAGFEVLERDGYGGFRLNPQMRIDRVAWEKLEKHGDPGIAKVAIERRKRKGKHER